MRKQLELASEFKSDLLDTIDWGKKQLVDFDVGKNSIDSFDWSNNSGAIDVRMDGSFKILGVLFFSLKFLFSDVDFYLYKATLYLDKADLHRKMLLCLSWLF